MSWVLEEELAELTREIVEAEFRVSELLRRIVEKAERGDLELDEEERRLEEATSPLISYPCKTLLEMVRDAIRAARLGKIPVRRLVELASYALDEWTRTC